MRQIEELERLGYDVGVAQDHSANDDVPVDVVYAVEGFGFAGHVADEADADRLLSTHAARAEEVERGPVLDGPPDTPDT